MDQDEIKKLIIDNREAGLFRVNRGSFTDGKDSGNGEARGFRQKLALRRTCLGDCCAR